VISRVGRDSPTEKEVGCLTLGWGLVRLVPKVLAALWERLTKYPRVVPGYFEVERDDVSRYGFKNTAESALAFSVESNKERLEDAEAVKGDDQQNISPRRCTGDGVNDSGNLRKEARLAVVRKKNRVAVDQRKTRLARLGGKEIRTSTIDEVAVSLKTECCIPDRTSPC
jgi:hypothetical protein